MMSLTEVLLTIYLSVMLKYGKINVEKKWQWQHLLSNRRGR